MNMAVTHAVFVMTGNFHYHPRRRFEERLLIAGMVAGRSLFKKTDFLVIGGRPSRDWLETNRGHKIIKALDLRNGSERPRLVSEAQLESLLSRNGL